MLKSIVPRSLVLLSTHAAESGRIDIPAGELVAALEALAKQSGAEMEGPALNGAAWLELGQAVIGVPPWVDPERYLRNSPLLGVSRIETSLMILHGDRDPVTDIAQSEELFTALYRLNKPAVLVRYWGEGHLLFTPANIRDKWRRVLEWYDSLIGSAPQNAKR